MEDKDNKEYKRFTVSLPTRLYEEFEDFRKNLYDNIPRSDLIRKAMNSFMISEKEENKVAGNIIGCIIYISTHEHFDPDHQHRHEHDDDHVHEDHIDDDHDHEHTVDELHEHAYISQPIYASVQQTDLLLINDIQHHFTDIILSTTHYHLAFERCLEIITVSGPYERVEKLKNSLQKLKSIISIKDIIIG